MSGHLLTTLASPDPAGLTPACGVFHFLAALSAPSALPSRQVSRYVSDHPRRFWGIWERRLLFIRPGIIL